MMRSVFGSLLSAIFLVASVARSAPSEPPNSLEKRATGQAAPHFVVYHDNYQSANNGFPTAAQLKGWNTLILAFWLTEGAWDNAQAWTTLSASTRSSIKSSLNSAGIKLMVSAFGSTDTPTTSGADATATAQKLASWVKQYGLDGVDVDYEDFTAFDANDGRAEKWLTTFTQTLRAALPAPTYIITHAPVAPWFSPSMWSGGGYLAVDKAVGSMIDWYNVQFYNQQDYTTCTSLLTKSSSQWPKTSVFEIAASGVPMSKIVIGKPGGSGDASDGYMAPASLATCVSQAKAKGWNGGIMSWESAVAYRKLNVDNDSAWLSVPGVGD